MADAAPANIDEVANDNISILRRQTSFSAMTMYARCPHQFYRRYLHKGGKIAPPGIALGVGTAFHFAHQVNYEQKIVSLKDVKPTVVRDAFMQSWDLTKKDIALTDEEKERGETLVVQEAESVGLATTDMFHETLSPLVMPTAVEKSFEFLLERPGKPTWKVRGRRDVDAAGVDWDREKILTTYNVFDLKSAKRNPNDDAADKSLQLVMYYMGFKFDNGEYPDNTGLLVGVKGKHPKAVVLTSRKGKADVDRLLNRLGHVIGAIESCFKEGFFPPCNPECWWCCPEYCGYWRECDVRTKF